MTTKTKVSLVVLLSCTLTTHAQEIIGVTGLSAHSLTKLKEFQQYYLNDAIVTLKSTQSFPPYFQHGLIARFPLNEVFKLGVYFYGTSTAARSIYEDYSGMIRVDQSLRCMGLGLYSSFDLMHQGKGALSAYFVPGVDLSTMTAAIDIRVGDSRESSKEDYTAISPMLEAGLEYTQQLGKGNFTLNFSGGFHYCKESMLTNKKSENEWEDVNWTGGKLMVGIGYKFAKD